MFYIFENDRVCQILLDVSHLLGLLLIVIPPTFNYRLLSYLRNVALTTYFTTIQRFVKTLNTTYLLSNQAKPTASHTIQMLNSAARSAVDEINGICLR